MFKNRRSLASTLKIGLLMVLACVTLGWANVPPPPVNQNLGIPDSTFNNLNKLNCAYCHAPEKLSAEDRAQIGWTFEAPTMKDGIIADRHHLRVVKGMIMSEHTQAPFGEPGQPYECFSCHKIENGEMINNFKNCTNCHTQMENASVHHVTEQAQALNCKHCHGARVDNPNDGHFIPHGRTPTMVTPRTSNGKGPNGEGACTFCHNSGVDEVSGIEVKSNAVNHHSTGIGQVGVSDLDCTLCHDRAGSDWAIRRCENCHGIKSIHSIQTDSNGDGQIIVGKESPYFGHIGNDTTDCLGCHGGILQIASMGAPGAPVTPELTDLSVFKVIAGSSETITVSGKSLTSVVKTSSGTQTQKSDITLTDSDGKVINLTPESISLSSIDVKIPADLAPGNYYLRAKKVAGSMESESNPMNLVILPYITISEVTTSNDMIVIAGSAFGTYMEASDSGLSVAIDGEKCNIDSWEDNKIVAKCNKQCGSIVVDSIFGNATYDLACGNDEEPTEEEPYVYTYDQGWDAGWNPGFEEGKYDVMNNLPYQIDSHFDDDGEYDDGWKAGYAYGYDSGWKSGGNEPVYTYDQGWDAGWNPGFAEGKSDALENRPYQIDSHFDDDGEYDDGWKAGYTYGYNVGWESVKNP